MPNRNPWDLLDFQTPLLSSRYCKSLQIPGKKQLEDYTCGFACVAMVLEYFISNEVSKERLYEQLGTTPDGTSEGQIVQCLRHYDISVKQKTAMETYHIKKAIDNNKLLIVYSHSLDHWSVVCGYRRYKVIVADPQEDKYIEMSWQEFKHCYTGYNIICQSVSKPSTSRLVE